MRALFAILSVLLASSALAAQVRVKSSHEALAAPGAQSPGYKVGANEVLRGATIGPAKVHVVLRRLAAPQSPPIAVKLMRDGREVARVLVGGEPVDPIEGEAEKASAPIDKVIEVPGGPHTLFVEVGAGPGNVLVSFDAPAVATPAPLVAKKPALRPLPAPASADELAAAKAAASAFAEGEGSAENPAVQLAELVTATPGEASRGTPIEPAAAQPVARSDTPAPAEVDLAGLVAPAPAAAEVELVGLVARAPTAAASEPVGLVESPPTTRGHGFLVGVRAGGANQLQLGAAGFAAGVSARWAPLGNAAQPSGSGLLVGLSVDALRYRMAFDVGAGRGVPAYSHAVSVTTVPLLAEASWSLGGRFSPTFGLSIGAALASLATTTAFSSGSELGLLFAAGLHAGIELPVGSDRLGLELRLVDATTGDDDEVRSLQVGGLIAQASWRFGL